MSEDFLENSSVCDLVYYIEFRGAQVEDSDSQEFTEVYTSAANVLSSIIQALADAGWSKVQRSDDQADTVYEIFNSQGDKVGIGLLELKKYDRQENSLDYRAAIAIEEALSPKDLVDRTRSLLENAMRENHQDGKTRVYGVTGVNVIPLRPRAEVFLYPRHPLYK